MDTIKAWLHQKVPQQNKKGDGNTLAQVAYEGETWHGTLNRKLWENSRNSKDGALPQRAKQETCFS